MYNTYIVFVRHVCHTTLTHSNRLRNVNIKVLLFQKKCLFLVYLFVVSLCAVCLCPGVAPDNNIESAGRCFITCVKRHQWSMCVIISISWVSYRILVHTTDHHYCDEQCLCLPYDDANLLSCLCLLALSKTDRTEHKDRTLHYYCSFI